MAIICESLVLYGRGGNSNTPDVFMPCWHPYYANACTLVYCCRMPPTRQSARLKTRAARRRSHVASTAVPVHPAAAQLRQRAPQLQNLRERHGDVGRLT